MKTTKFGDNLWQVTRMGIMNCYLVGEADGLTLIDTGMGGSAKGLLQASSAIGQPIRRILLTHAHSDHAGSLDALAEALPEAEILLGERSAVFLSDPAARQPLPNEPQVKLGGSFVDSKIKPTRTIGDGDLIGSLRVLASPGHSPDHLAYLDERDGSLIGGDAFQTLGGMAVSGIVRWRFPFPGWATWHLPTALQTAKKLRDLKPSRLAIGHGKVLNQPLAAIEKAIQEAEATADGQAKMA